MEIVGYKSDAQTPYTAVYHIKNGEKHIKNRLLAIWAKTNDDALQKAQAYLPKLQRQQRQGNIAVLVELKLMTYGSRQPKIWTLHEGKGKWSVHAKTIFSYYRAKFERTHWRANPFPQRSSKRR